MKDLYKRLLEDLSLLDIDLSGVEIVFRPFSKTMDGYYDPNKNIIVLYVKAEKNGKEFLPYNDILVTALHECTHYIQWSDPNFKRVKGVMHNAQFYKILHSLVDTMKKKGVLK